MSSPRTRSAAWIGSIESRLTPSAGTTESSTSRLTLSRMRERVALRDVGAVGGAVERDLAHPERTPQRVEVLDGVGGREEAALVADRSPRSAARPRRGGGVRSEAPIALCSAGHFSASAPVPRWSIATSRSLRRLGPEPLARPLQERQPRLARARRSGRRAPARRAAPATATRRSQRLVARRRTGRAAPAASSTSRPARQGTALAPRNRGRGPASAARGRGRRGAVAVGSDRRRRPRRRGGSPEPTTPGDSHEHGDGTIRIAKGWPEPRAT